MSSSTSTDLRDLNHGSFSFSCSESDLNFSSLSHFTDGDDDDESYIEIALDHHHGRDPKPTRRDDDVDDQGNDYVGGFDDHSEFLRISFSSSLLPEISNAAAASSAAPPGNLSCSSSMESSCRGPVADECSSRQLPRSGSGKRGRLPAVNRLVNTLLFGHRSPSSELRINADTADLARSRKASNIRTSINGGIMKLLFKFRAMNLGALVSALVKPRQVAQEAHTNSQRKKSKDSVSSTTSTSNNRSLHEYHQKVVQKRQGKIGIKNKDSSDGGGEKSGRMLLEINLGAVRGVLEAIGNSMSTGVGRKDRRTMSCPSSIKSSPIHHQGFTSDEQSNRVYVYTRETSVQAAIAHCKTSLQH